MAKIMCYLLINYCIQIMYRKDAGALNNNKLILILHTKCIVHIDMAIINYYALILT